MGLQLVLNANVTGVVGTVTGYRWYEESLGLVGATTTPTFSVSAAGKYRVVVITSNTCWTVASDIYEVTVSTDPNCMSSGIILSVTNDTVAEGLPVASTIKVTLAGGYVATSNMTINLSYAGTAEQGVCTPGNGHNDYQVVSGTPTILTILAGQDEASVNISTCTDGVYEGNETIIVSATHNGSPLVQSPRTITIIDSEAGVDGKLTLAWQLENTLHIDGNDVVDKGQTAGFTLTAVAPDGITQINVQNSEQVQLEYLVGSTAQPGTHYDKVIDATIPAGGSSIPVSIDTRNDNVMHKNYLELITDIVTSHNKKNSAQLLYIKSVGLNPLGGFDFTATLAPNSPAEVEEGQSFTLTIETASGLKVGEDISFNIAATDIRATLGVDYNISTTTPVMLEGTSSIVVTITTVDNTLFDGDRDFELRVTPVDPKDRVTSHTPNPMIGLIKDNDLLCLTITSDVEGIDEVNKSAVISVEAHNLGTNVGSLVLKLENQNTAASHFVVPAEFNAATFVTLTTASPRHDFVITSSLVPDATVTRENFDISTYTSVFEELLIAINFGVSSVNLADLECYEPLTLTNSDDFDQDGLPNWLERGDDLTGDCKNMFNGDTNGNTKPNEWDAYDPSADDDGDGIPNWMEDINRDGNPYNDGNLCLPNFANPDSDGDGVPDSVEYWSNRTYDDNEGDIRIHPALSLNEDGIGNDMLYIENISNYPGNKVTIFDRQGIVVFEQTDYTNTADKAFNGVANKKSKKKVPLGTYFVIVEYTKGGVKMYYDRAVEVRY